MTKALPAFPSRGKDKSVEAIEEQIGELQSAATTNAESIKSLAEQLQRTVQAVEEGSDALERRVQASIGQFDEVRSEVQKKFRAVEENLTSCQHALNQVQDGLTQSRDSAASLGQRVARFEQGLARSRIIAFVALCLGIASIFIALAVLVRI